MASMARVAVWLVLCVLLGTAFASEVQVQGSHGPYISIVAKALQVLPKYHGKNKCFDFHKGAKGCHDDNYEKPYCCGTHCKIPVPRPPHGLPDNASGLRSPKPWSLPPGTKLKLQPVAKAARSGLQKTLRKSGNAGSCPAKGLRQAVSGPPLKAFDGINAATVLINMVWTSEKGCTDYTNACTGNVIAPHLVLTATHCVLPAIHGEILGVPECGSYSLAAVQVCSNYNPGSPNPNFECPMDGQGGAVTRAALGVSVNTDWSGFGEQNDVAIVFLKEPIKLHQYYKYNYLENFMSAPYNENTWISKAYSGPGTPTPAATCGCDVCPHITCNLAKTGPIATRGIPLDAQGGIVPGMETCNGGSGACLAVNDDACCVGVLSYGGEDAADACNVAQCSTSAWSPVSASFPLSQLWDAIDFPLGQE